MKEFIINEEYKKLLLQNTEFHLRVRSGKVSYQSSEYQLLQKKLVQIERVMPTEDIIKHAEILFPKVGIAE